MLFVAGLIVVMLIAVLMAMVGMGYLTWLVVKTLFIVFAIASGIVGAVIGYAIYPDPAMVWLGAIAGVVLGFGCLIRWQERVEAREAAEQRARELAQRLAREAEALRKQQEAARQREESERRRNARYGLIINSPVVNKFRKWLD